MGITSNLGVLIHWTFMFEQIKKYIGIAIIILTAASMAAIPGATGTARGGDLDNSPENRFLNLGSEKAAKGDHLAAVEAYSRALEINPQSIEALMGRGWVLAQTGYLDEAVQDFSKVIAIEPKNAAAYLARGMVRHRLNQLGLAISDYTSALDINSDLTTAYMQRGLAERHQKDFDQAIKDFSRAIKLEPGNADAWLQRGLAYYQKGDLDEAIEDTNEAIKRKPDMADGYFNRAVYRRDQGDLAAALADGRQALDLDPKDQAKKDFVADLESRPITAKKPEKGDTAPSGAGSERKKSWPASCFSILSMD